MATRWIELDDQWQEIATGACLIEVDDDNGSVQLHFGNDVPAADTKAKHKLNRIRGLSFKYGGRDKTWARVSSGIEHIIVT